MTGDAFHVDRRGDVCDITIYDNVKAYPHEAGVEYDFDEYILPGVPWSPEIEDNIREHFQAWRAHAAAFTAQRAAMLAIIDQATALAGLATDEGRESTCTSRS